MKPKKYHGNDYMVGALVTHIRKLIIKESVPKLRRMKKELKFDTIVFQGMSGALVAPELANRLNVGTTLVRKEKDNSHSLNKTEGAVPKRFIVVDDFVDSGATVKSAVSSIKKVFPEAEYVGLYLYDGTPGSSHDCQPVPVVVRGQQPFRHLSGSEIGVDPLGNLKNNSRRYGADSTD
jgi:orotate phosphoribosyltransferase-like protein